MTDWKQLCAKLAEELGTIVPLVYNIASDDQEEAEEAQRLNHLVSRAYEALDDASSD